VIEIFCIIFESIFFNKTISEGRSETDVIIMLKMLVLHLWHGLSDFELWKQGIDRISFRKFLGVTGYIPDSTTVWLFKIRIINSCKEDEIEGKLQSQPDSLVFENKKGIIQDSTFIPSDSTCKSR
jgi:IS5 family transposase